MTYCIHGCRSPWAKIICKRCIANEQYNKTMQQPIRLTIQAKCSLLDYYRVKQKQLLSSKIDL